MATYPLVCPSCGAENLNKAKYCEKCGTTFSNNQQLRKSSDKTKSDSSLTSIAPITGVILCLLFFDYYGDHEINWSLWAIVPLAVFGIIVPILNWLILRGSDSNQ